MPSFFQTSWVRSVKISGAERKMRSPVLKKSRTFIWRPHSASNFVHRSIARFAQVAHSSALAPRSPYELRTPRVSSPDVAREFPGPYASTSLTDAPELPKVVRRPAAERARADDDDVCGLACLSRGRGAEGGARLRGGDGLQKVAAVQAHAAAL